MEELAKRFADLAEKFGPSVADAALAAARMEAISMLVGSLMWFGVSAAAIYTGRYLCRLAGTEDWDNDWVILGATLMGLGAILALPGIWNWIDPWTWTALNSPELWIAKKAFKL